MKYIVTGNSIEELDALFGRKVPIWIKDTKHNYVACNQAFIDKLGLSSPEQILGQNDSSLNKSPAYAALSAKHNDEIMTGEKARVFIEEASFNNENTGQVQAIFKQPVYSTHEKLIGCLSINASAQDFDYLKLINYFLDVQKRQSSLNSLPKLLERVNTKAKLSKREYECFYYIGEGMSYRAIAEKLKLSTRTIEAYAENIRHKLNCANKSQLVRLANQINATEEA